MDVLISGASVAGLATGFWLARTGHDVTVIDLAGGLRSGGVAIDVRGDAVGTAARMGILDEIKNREITTNGTYTFVDAAGGECAALTLADQVYDSHDDIELRRDHLVDVLHRAVPDSVEFRFDSSVVEAAAAPDHVDVRLSDGLARRFDLVVGADGLHSNVRSHLFGPEHDFVQHLGCYVGIVRDCESLGPVTGTYVYNVPNRMVALAGDGTTCTALVAFRGPAIEYDFRDVDAHKRIVQESFAGERGWVVADVLAEIERSDSFYFDSVSQVRTGSWSRGRSVLVGDAGYAPSFFSGMGTSLAMRGAEVLAELLQDPAHDLEGAFASYRRTMQTAVEGAQELALAGMDLLFPRSAAAIAHRNEQLRLGRHLRDFGPSHAGDGAAGAGEPNAGSGSSTAVRIEDRTTV